MNSSISDSEYTTIHSAPPKRPSGRTKFKETRHPVYRGVRRRGTSGKWVCEVRNPNNKSRIWLGTFPNADMAARAHDMAMMALQGRSACLNFADSAWLIKLPESFSSVDDIKKAAIKVAESFRLKEPSSSSPPPSPSSPSSSESSAEVAEEILMPVVSDEMVNLEIDYCNNLGFDMDEYSAEGIELPVNWFDDLEDHQWEVSLWSWS